MFNETEKKKELIFSSSSNRITNFGFPLVLTRTGLLLLHKTRILLQIVQNRYNVDLSVIFIVSMDMFLIKMVAPHVLAINVQTEQNRINV